MKSSPFKKISGASQAFYFAANDIRLILDQIQNPCLLINLDTKNIIAVNYKFTEFTGIGSDEIAGLSIDHVIVNCDFDKIIDGSVNYWNVSRKNKSPSETAISIMYIGKTEKLALFMFPDEDHKLIEQQPISDRMLDELITLADQIRDLSLEDLLIKLMACSKSIFPVKYAVLYMQEQKSAELKKILSDESLFPNTIPVIELKRLSQIDFWEPGKRVLSEIHRVGRLKNLDAVVTIPVTIVEERKGLMILAFDDPKAKTRYEKLIRVFSDWISILIKIQTSTSMLFERSSKIKGEIDRYIQFYENASDCAVILNDKNIIIDFNKNTSEFLGYSPIEVLSQPAEVIFENSEIKGAILQNKEDNENFQKEPVYIHHREGKNIPIFFKIIPMVISSQNQKLLIIRDASIKVEADKKIQSFENKAALGEVVADFAHEVRNPINNLSTGLQLLAKKVNDLDPNKEIIERMQEDCLRINDLMESVLSYSRQKIENFKQLDIEQLIRRIINRMKPKFNNAGVTTIIKSDVQNMHIHGDQRSLEQVFTNLITNGFDAIKQTGGVISVMIARNEMHQESLEIQISDTGPGIPPEIKEKLFEPFVTDKPKGTGLGLAITKRIIEAHHGKIELETFPGGTIFKVYLPIQNNQGDLA